MTRWVYRTAFSLSIAAAVLILVTLAAGWARLTQWEQTALAAVALMQTALIALSQWTAAHWREAAQHMAEANLKLICGQKTDKRHGESH